MFAIRLLIIILLLFQVSYSVVDPYPIPQPSPNPKYIYTLHYAAGDPNCQLSDVTKALYWSFTNITTEVCVQKKCAVGETTSIPFSFLVPFPFFSYLIICFCPYSSPSSFSFPFLSFFYFLLFSLLVRLCVDYLPDVVKNISNMAAMYYYYGNDCVPSRNKSTVDMYAIFYINFFLSLIPSNI